ncbi:hypothetical protein PJ267_01690 [Arthrobacter sp. OVS8]|nr:hypothetical protein PJ267_01690 [Arthrobacter sp. OVS8]
MAASNAVLGLKRQVSGTVPRVTFTSPEVAAVGLTVADSRQRHRSRTVRHTHVDRAVTQDSTDGFTRLILDRRGKSSAGPSSARGRVNPWLNSPWQCRRG